VARSERHRQDLESDRTIPDAHAPALNSDGPSIVGFTSDGRPYTNSDSPHGSLLQQWDIDVTALPDRICATVGHSLTREQWIRALPADQYRPSTPGSATDSIGTSLPRVAAGDHRQVCCRAAVSKEGAPRLSGAHVDRSSGSRIRVRGSRGS
jgi:hypothetical protein